MAIYNTPDGRQVVGSVESGNDYHGFNGKRDIIIQLTADGATADGLNALEYLKAYAVEQNKQNNPIFPNGTRVWISANGYTKAVEADDIVIDGENVTIGGIAWNGEAWDFTNAGQTGSSLPAVTGEDDGKVLTVVDGAWQPASGGSGGGDGVLKVAQTAVNPAAKGATKGGGYDDPDDPSTTTYYLDKTYSEIAAATLAVVVANPTHLPIIFVGTVGSTRTVKTLSTTGNGTITWTASSDSGYPSRTE